MPLSGGATDKFGNRYEGLWTVDCIIDVIDEKASSIRLEPPGEEGEGVEFWLDRDNCREYHQVKRQNTQGRWSISDLASKQILSNFYKKLIEPSSKCVFISTAKAYQLDELADRARGSQSWQEFKKEFFSSKDLEQSFYKIASHWSEYSDKEIEEAISAINNSKPSSTHIQIDGIAQNAYKFLKRVDVETESESRLRKILETRLRYLVEKNTNDLSFQDESPTIVDILAQFALDKVHHELNTVDIWHHLKQRGYRHRNWSKDYHVLAAVQNINNSYVSRLKDIAIADKIIARDETQTVLEKLKYSYEKRALLVTGEAGVGKSIVMLQVLENLINEGVPILSFRVDNLNPVAHPDDVGKQLQLPGSPATVLASIAQKRECVLVIDQLDAVSLTSGRHPDFFECINEIIQQALIHSNIHLLVACRKFDLDNDHRLKKLTGEQGIAETININRLTHDKVKELVTELNLDVSRLSRKQLDLLSIPLHLYLLSQIAEDSDFSTLNFQTAKDLFDRFCDYKQAKLRERLGYSVKWTKVTDSLVKYMSDKQTLFAPENVVRHYKDDAKIMTSENILTWSGNKISFLHQSFFDYLFVDFFVESNINLLEFLQGNEQHLFRRTQVRQILIHERETDPDEYIEHLEELLTSNDIRFHIKQIVFAWLGTSEDPKEEEWEILASIFESDDTYSISSAWSAICMSISWFRLLHLISVIKQWLNSDREQDINRVIYLLWNAQKGSPEVVAEVLISYINVSEEWDRRINKIINRLELGNNHQIFDLFAYLIKKGHFVGKSKTVNHERDFWSQIHSLVRKRPDWACEAITIYLNHYLDLSVENGQNNLFARDNDIYPYSQSADSAINETAKKSPKSFVVNVLPFIIRIVKLNVITSDEKILKDKVWKYKHYGSYYNFEDVLLIHLENALRNLAINQSDKCSEIINNHLIPNRGYDTIKYLLIRTFAADGAIFANEAADFLCEEPSRLATGYEICNGNIHASPYWATHQLLVEIIPYCSTTKLKQIESLILNYYPQWNGLKQYQSDLILTLHSQKIEIIFKFLNLYPELLYCIYVCQTYQYLEKVRKYIKYTHHLLGYPQFTLLNSFRVSVISQLNTILPKIVAFLLSVKANYFKISYLILLSSNRLFDLSDVVVNRLSEWQRKFKSIGLIEDIEVIQPPEAIEAYAVGSPIEQDSADYMTDKEWLKAISAYSESDMRYRSDFTKGGAVELSRTLEKCVQKEPVRFVNLIGLLPDDTNTSYFDAVLRGIAEVEEIDIRIALSAVQRCDRLPGKPCGSSISWLFQKLARLPWSIGALNIIICYATTDPDPDRELWRTEASNGQVYYGGEVFTAGINSVRGAAVQAIAKLIFADKTRGAYFQYALEQMVRDKSLAVRSCAAEALVAMLNYDRDLAVKLFLTLCDTEDIILGTQTVDRFLYYATHNHLETLKPILERMIYSDSPQAVKAGARQSCIAALGNEQAQSLVDYCLSSGTTAHRKALAQVFASNFKSADFRQYCEDGLIKLFQDSDEEVRSQAARCFYELKENELENHTNLLKAFVNSPSFASDSEDLIYALEKTTAKLPKETYLVCDRFVKNLQAQQPEQKSYIRDGDRISQLLIRLYTQSKRQMRAQCLDLIDRLCEMNVYGLDRALLEYER
ncbi:ATP-binding protein [Waterburya agarophytonicola K14]|uniref:ATP-binding protein n=1 Tax=Waterburya agarophytonicola KI4 TaxID=2874699 RepID=A0A964BM17_9CYAN|nr:ATP-binding protein [Waterburya agarophytonicola]MCC0175893.1 ATP-binding protein [Waterburya agarophytonicola KI4]